MQERMFRNRCRMVDLYLVVLAPSGTFTMGEDPKDDQRTC